MSEKLSFDESLESMDAINQYRMDNPGTNIKRVIVKKGMKIIFNDEIKVIAGDYNTYFKLDILWEDVGFDFRNNGLYGSYSSTYYIIEYDCMVLTIYSDDIEIEIM